MSKKDIILNWEYVLYDSDYSEQSYTEIVTGKETGEDVHSGFGYIAMLDYARRVINHDRDTIIEIDDEIVKKYCVEGGYGKYYLISLMFAIAADELKKLAIDLRKHGNSNAYKRAIKKVPEEYKKNIQGFFNEQVEQISYHFTEYQKKTNIEYGLWELLLDKIFDICAESKRKGKRLKLLEKYIIKKDMKDMYCLGLYEFDDTSVNEGLPLVTFSGFKDVSELNEEKTGFTKATTDFPSKIEEVCNHIPATLVTPSMDICRYRIGKDANVEVDCSLGDEINKRGFVKEVKKEFSCCERKIFTKFDEKNNNNGILHTTFFPCERCQLGILYYWQKGTKIDFEYAIKDGKSVINKGE